MVLLSMLLTTVIAALSGMGVGGGGLFMLYLTYFTELSQTSAQGLNLLFFLLSSGASLPFHLRKRRIYATAVLLTAAGGLGGVALGTALAQVIAPSLLRKTFGCLLIVGGILALQRGTVGKEEKVGSDKKPTKLPPKA